MNKKWIKISGLALALPSTLFASAWFFTTLYRSGYISEGLAWLLVLLSVINIFYLMFYYAFKRKN